MGWCENSELKRMTVLYIVCHCEMVMIIVSEKGTCDL